jgi:predicted AlkP superfamily phosphohydrolase/phosphomutase
VKLLNLPQIRKMKPTFKKVIVIGLDGFEPTILEAMQQKGDLPHLTKLKNQGSYSHLGTTYPAQTPVAWSTFSTGTNPGGHGIFDFLGRDLQTYFPILALNRYEQKNAFVPPQVINLRRGIPIWKVLSQAGIPSAIIRNACTYPPDEINGRMLAGVGVPDMRGGLGTSTFYTSNPEIKAETSEKVIQIRPDGNGTVITQLIGPFNPKDKSDITVEITLRIHKGQKKVIIQTDGQPTSLEVPEGQWSDWLKVKFKIGFLQSVRGMVRFYLVRCEPEFELYASPINFDPDAPWFPISSPPEYAQELQKKVGTYYTTGMVEDHEGIINGRFDETAFLQQCSDVMHEREKMLLYELERMPEGLIFCLFDTPDRLQHIFWRFREKEHPANKNGIDPKMLHVIEDHYRSCDAMVGEALEYSDDRTLFIVLSDHGMSSFQRGLNLNTWLFENGYLFLNNGIKPGEEAGDFLKGLDWSRTKAYSLGLGAIYLNMKGREKQGIIDASEVGKVKNSIITSLTGLRDPQRGTIVVRSVMAREQIYSGEYISEAPDLLVNFSPGYRVSWGTPLGGVPVGLFEDNCKKWGGDHVIDPVLIPGVLLMNRSFNAEGPNILDMAPTILDALGVPKYTAMEGESLLL